LINTNNRDTVILDVLNFSKVSVKVLNLKLDMPAELRLLKNCVGQISSTIELNNISLIKEYNISTTNTSSKVLYKYISNFWENNNSNIL